VSERPVNGDESLPLELTRAVEAVCDRFEAALKANQRPRLEDFLPDVPDTARGLLLRELVLREVAYRRRMGQIPEREDTPMPPPGAIQQQPTLDEPPTFDRNKGIASLLAPAQSADELGRLGPYRVLKVLGQGGMGVVFLAEDPKLGRKLALKAILPALAASTTGKERFLREARAAALLRHDNIVVIHHVDEDRGISFLAMEYLPGETLAKRLERKGPLPLAEVLRIGQELAQGLAAAHKQGMVHRDVKPGNIWLETEHCEGEKPDEHDSQFGSPSSSFKRVKLLDFGLVRLSDQGPLTGQGGILGTPAYMAPEQILDPAQAEAPADVYGLGCVLYEMSTGKRPFQSQDAVEVLMGAVRRLPEPPRKLNPAIPRVFSELVMKLLSPLAKERGSAAAAASGLKRLAPSITGTSDRQKSKPGKQSEETNPAMGGQHAPNRTIWFGMGLAGTVAAFASVIWSVATGRRQKPAESGQSVVLAAIVVALLVVGAGVATAIWMYQKPRQQGTSNDSRQAPPTEPAETQDYTALLSQKIESAMCDPSPNPPDFKSLQNDCETIYRLDEHNDRHATWLAECYVETQNQEGARDLRGHLRKDTPYPAYVSAMLATFADNLSVAADDMLAVITAQAEKPAPELEVPWRQQRAADLLTTAAIRQREEPDPSKPFKQLYPKEKADVAYRWLAKAEALAGSTPPASLQANLALAAWYKSEPDKETARRLAAQALTQPTEALQASNTLFPLLTVKASADAEDKANPGKALADYAQALNQIRIVKGKSQIRFDVDDLKRVLDSALDLEKSLPVDDASTKPSLAQIYDFKGWLAWRFETEAYDKYAQVALDAFNRAAALDRKLPYVVYRGFARLSAARLTRSVIDEMKADLDEAEQLDPKHRQTHFLAGYIDQNEARLETDYSRKYQLTNQAVAEFDKALKSKDDDLDRNEEVPLLSYNLCSASLELGSYDASNRQTHLEKALQSVNDAEAAGATSHLSRYAKGLVQEDLAWLCGRTQLYQAAIKSLRDAAEDRDYLAKYSMAKGRCEFKYAAFGNGGLPFLKDAIDDLNKALRKSPQKKERVESCYWLGRACALRGNFRPERPQLNGDYLEADTDFSAGLKAFDEAALRDPTWKHLLSKAAAGLPLLEAEAIQAKKGTADIASLLEEADKRAVSLAELAGNNFWDAGKLEAARIRCAVLELKSQSSSALDAYMQAIRAYEEQSKTSKPGGLEEFYVLNVARLNCYLDAQERQALTDKQKLNGKDVAEALEQMVAGLNAISVEPETKAIASFAAGRAHQALAESATGADPAPTEQRLAVDDFKKALDELPELSFRTPKWQRTLAVAYKKLVNSASPQNKEQYRKEAGDWLRQAMKNAAPGERQYFRDILNLLQS
jgi:serine/threonine protein kinase